MSRITQQHSVVIGGSSGIGLAAAHALVRAGHRVTLAARNPERLNSAREKFDVEVGVAVLDASDPESVRLAFEGIEKFDHLVAAVPSQKGLGSVADLAGGEIAAGFLEKTVAQLTCVQAALPWLRKDGSITLISAVTAGMALPGTAGIAAVNAGVNALVPVLAAELKPLRVNAVAPGVIDTPWWNFLNDEQRRAAFADFAAKTPVGRVGRAEDVGDMIAFLVGNSFVNGQVIACDGGLRLTA